jgi:hypothetical protein
MSGASRTATVIGEVGEVEAMAGGSLGGQFRARCCGGPATAIYLSCTTEQSDPKPFVDLVNGIVK